MRTKTTLAILVLIGFSTMSVLASSPAEMPEGADANAPASITADVKCRIDEVDANESTLVLVDLENESRHVVALDDKVKLRARKKKDFDGRKKLGLADLRKGQTVKVTYYVTDLSIRSITVLEAA